MMQRLRTLPILLTLAALCSGGCGEDLGTCDDDTAGGLAAVEAGAAIGTSCTACHSSQLEGDARQGAPAELDFDTDEKRDDWAQEMWAEVEAGRMPPAKPAGTGELSGDDKEAFRNWLACGGDDIASTGGCTTGTWCESWNQIEGSCIACHSTANPAVGGGVGLVVAGDACASLQLMLGVDPTGPTCGGTAAGAYIVAGDADASLLVQKLRATTAAPAPCGSPMPPGGAGLASTNPQLVDTLAQWITAGADAPECL